jgi:hypothetical protein
LVLGAGYFTLVYPNRAELLRVDESWPAARPSETPYSQWEWEPELRGTDERFALRADDGRIHAVWAVTKAIPKLDGATWYRPSVLEVHPSGVRGQLGTAAVAVIARRACELDAAGVVVEAIPAARAFYERLGARARGPNEFRSWRVSDKLVPLVFDGSAVVRLREVFDELCATAASGDVP